MAHTFERSLSSLTAIAAASLLLSTPAHAQPPDPQAATTPEPPPPPAPEVPPPAQPDPTPTPPQAAATPAPVLTTNPVVQALPDSSQTPPAPVTATPPRAARTATHAAAAAPKAVVARPATQNPAPAPREPAATASPVTTTTTSTLTRRDPAGLYSGNGATAATPTPAASSQSPYARYWPLEAGGVIVLVGLIGYALTRRRDEEEEDEQVLAPTLAPQAGTAPPPAMLAQNDIATLAGPVPSGAAREALLKRMVDAAPDEANPFTTRKARMHRARLILQTRKQALRDQAVETFDWRTYRPSLTHPTLGATKTVKEPVK